MATNFNKIEAKWQKAWEDKQAFKAESDSKKKKYYIAMVYPYANGLLHLGHLYTYIYSDVMLRFKRLQGFNTHMKVGYHCTGTPIVAAAKRVEENEKEQIKILESMGIAKKDISKFKDAEYWTKYWPKEIKKDLIKLGFSHDDRYTFKTTSLNPPYDAMVKWQFNKLKEKDLVKKGKHPVVWCPKDNAPVGDHARSEGEGETPQDFIWNKFKMKDSDLILMAGTTRPDALYGQTNLWVDPKGDYIVTQVEDEKWVTGSAVFQKIKDQYENAEIIRKIKPKELIGKIVQGPLVDYEIPVIPAHFIDAAIGSGIVYSALEDPVDLFELKKIQSDPEKMKEFGIDKKTVMKLYPIHIIDVPGMGSNLGEEIGKEFNITSSDQTDKLEKAKGEMNKRVFRKGIMRDNCGECSGMTVPKAQEFLKKKLVEEKDSVMFYELAGKVVCRCLTTCIVKVVSDQWFIEYNNEDWKKQTHKCLDKMQIFPEQNRKQLDYVIDWLNRWACVREFGLGTKLPWDEDWVIESLSDSTIQMAYATISKYLQNSEEYNFKTDKINDEFFDFVFLGKGSSSSVEKSTSIPKKMIETMRKDFDYWYPFDFRNTAKDLIQNHMTFCLFNHTAIFPEDKWPKAYGLNGRIMVDNEKMSKSKGNFFTARELYEKHGADIVRLAASNAGEGIDDANYEMAFLDSAKKRLNELKIFIEESYNKGSSSKTNADPWFESAINTIIKETTESMENVKFKSALQTGFFDMRRYAKKYMKKTGNKPNKELINFYIESQIKILSPFCPHICEELWETIKKKSLVSLESYPKANEKKINKKYEDQEKAQDKIVEDIKNIFKLIKDKPKQVYVYVMPNELEIYNQEELESMIETPTKVFAVNDKDKHDPENKSKKAKPGKPGIYIE